MTEQAGELVDSENSIFALELDVSTPIQPRIHADGTDLTAPSLVGLVKSQATDAFCQATANKLGKIETKTTIDKKDFVVWHAHIDEALQKLLPQSLRQRFLTLSQCAPLSSHR